MAAGVVAVGLVAGGAAVGAKVASDAAGKKAAKVEKQHDKEVGALTGALVEEASRRQVAEETVEMLQHAMASVVQEMRAHEERASAFQVSSEFYVSTRSSTK